MKKSLFTLGLLVLLGSTGIASAEGFAVAAGPRGFTAAVSLPGMRLIYGRPNTYCWYQGRFYDRVSWDRFCRFHRGRFAYYRQDRDFDRNYRGYDRDRFNNDRHDQDHRNFDRDGNHDRF